MKAPIYRVGQKVDVIGYMAGEMFRDEFFVPCRIIHPNEDGTYFAQVEKTGGYTMIDDTDILPSPEYNTMAPYPRRNVRVVFFGNGLFALPTLKMLFERGYDVAAVVTMEDGPRKRGGLPHPSPVKEYADLKGTLVFQPENLKSVDFTRQLRELDATVFVVAEYRMLPKAVIEIPKWGCINLHSSLLPMYRGASTITSAIKDGNTLTGVTTFFIDEDLDEGNIINNLGIEIKESDSAEDVHARLRTAGAVMVDDAVQRVAHSCRGVPQSQIANNFIQPSHAPKLYRNDAFIPWCSRASKVYDFIRAHSSVVNGCEYPENPAIANQIPTAWTTLKLLSCENEIEVKIHKASKTAIPRGHHAPGEWFWQDGKLVVACADELISVDILQLPCKRRMTAKEYHNGLRDACKGFCRLIDSNYSNY